MTGELIWPSKLCESLAGKANYPLVMTKIANWKAPPFLMGNIHYFLWSFSVAMLQITRGSLLGQAAFWPTWIVLSESSQGATQGRFWPASAENQNPVSIVIYCYHGPQKTKDPVWTSCFLCLCTSDDFEREILRVYVFWTRACCRKYALPSSLVEDFDSPLGSHSDQSY